MLAGYSHPMIWRPWDIPIQTHSSRSDRWASEYLDVGSSWAIFSCDLLSSSLADQNLYTMLLLYTNGNCAAVPGGCPPGMPIPTPTPPPAVCPAAFIQTGPIQVTGGSGRRRKDCPPQPGRHRPGPRTARRGCEGQCPDPAGGLPLLRSHPPRGPGLRIRQYRPWLRLPGAPTMTRAGRPSSIPGTNAVNIPKFSPTTSPLHGSPSA